MAFGVGNNYGMGMQYNSANPYYNNGMYQNGQMQGANNMMPQPVNNMQYGGVGAVNQGASRMYVRPVSSFDEAKASMIDLDGSMYVFTDISNRRIYTKQVLLDGTADIKTYVLLDQAEQKQEEVVIEPKPENNYVLKKDYNKAIKQLNEKLNKIMEVIDDESYGNHADAGKK